MSRPAPEWPPVVPTSQPPLSGGAQERTRVVRRMRERWDSLVPWFELIRNLAVRDIEIRYKHSILGLYWALLNPLITAAVFGFVFGVIFHATSGSVPYVVFLLTGLTFWNLFANGVLSATVSITGSAALLAKLYFPRVVLTTASVLARLIDFAFSLVILAVFVVIYRTPIYGTAIWVLPILGVEVLFTLGVGYLTAALNVLYRDMTQLTGLAMLVLMYVTPVMYALGQVQGGLQGVLLMNPLGAILQAERDLLFTGHLTQAPFLWAAVCWSVFVFLGGLVLFKRIEPVFAEVM